MFLGCFSTPDGHRQQQEEEEEEIKKKNSGENADVLRRITELTGVSQLPKREYAQPIKHNHHIFIICSETNKTVGNYTNVENTPVCCVFTLKTFENQIISRWK